MDYKYIDFILIINVEGMHFQPHKPEGIEFKVDSEDNLRFVLRPKDPEEDACGHRLGLECKVYKSYPASDKQVKFVTAFNKHRKMINVSDEITLPFKPNDEILISEDGICADRFSPRRDLLPTYILEIIESVELELNKHADRFFKLLRWRQFCDAPGEVLKSSSLYWRVGEGEYPITPLDGGTSNVSTVNGMFGIHWSERHKNDMQNLWLNEGLTEPLGHTLLREAATLSQESPRSSILMITAALETAVKTHISKIVPDAKWLMEKSPAPPIDKILRQYIPLLHKNKSGKINFWKKLNPEINKVEKLIVIRNKIAHTGKLPEITKPVQNYIELVSDFLYIIDVLDGHEWAKSLVGYELRKSLDWPNPIDKRIKIKISQGY